MNLVGKLKLKEVKTMSKKEIQYDDKSFTVKTDEKEVRHDMPQHRGDEIKTTETPTPKDGK